MRRLLRLVIVLAFLALIAMPLAIGLGGPADVPPMASINNPFASVDFSDLPDARSYAARDDERLAYRLYTPSAPEPAGSVVLIHGSSANSDTMHVTAREMARAGYLVYVPDVRGHGASGEKGRIDYVGQLEDDIEDLLAAARPTQPVTLAGFSAGGGFALRVAGSDRQRLFANYLLLSPFIGTRAPTYRPDSGGWVSVGMPRLVSIAICNAMGLKFFNELPVIRFGLNEEAKAYMTPYYSYALAVNFAPRNDYRANMADVTLPLEVVAGRDDEVFRADLYARALRDAGLGARVTLVPGSDHIGMTLDPWALEATVAALNRLNDRQ